MTQNRTTAYHALDTSARHNEQMADVIRPGVYKGYKLRVNAAEPNRLDVTVGSDLTSVLLTYEGVKIEETGDLYGVLAVANADASQERIDLAVAEYTFSVDDDVEQQYKLLRGRYAPTGTTPTPPSVQSVYQIPLAYVRVRPRSAFSSSARAQIETEDIIHIGRAADARSPQDVSSLMPIIEPSDNRLLFVHAGVLPTFDGSAALQFSGGYSEAIDPTTLSDGEEAWYLFGISDDGVVEVVSTAATEAALPAFTGDVFPVCKVMGKKLSGTVMLQRLVDIRFPFARQIAARTEEETYKATLADSVFEHVRIEPFRDLDMLAQDTLSDSDVTLTLNRGATSAEFLWEGDDDLPAADVEIATVDLLSGTSIGVVEHFMMLVDADMPGMRMKFSTTSKYSGFSTATFNSGTIVRIPAGGAMRLYVKFVIPAEAFADAATLRLRSFGCFLSLNSEALSQNTLADVGLDTLQLAVPNLIANGNFRIWSRDDADGNTPDPDAKTEIAYEVSAEQPFAADGWQFTTLSFPARNGRVSRLGLTQDILASGDANYGDTALWWEGSGGSGGGLNVLEYRTQVPANSDGHRVTFAVKYKLSSVSALSIGVALYEMTEEKTLRLQAAPTIVSPVTVRGDLIAVSDIAINERTHAVAFLIQLRQTAGDSSAALWNARAAIGEYRALRYTEAVGAADLLRKYYERGRLFVAGSVQEGTMFGGSVQFGAKKLAGLGELSARTIQRSDSNRSLNLGDPAYDVTADGLVATATATSAGGARLDVDFEAFVTYAPVG